MRPALPFRHPHTEADLMRLHRLLAEGLRLVEFAIPCRPWTLLNLACGRADETGILWQLLGCHAPGRYLGVDLRTAEIEEARTRWIPAAPPEAEIAFETGDASFLLDAASLADATFIFIRHQNFWHDPVGWNRLYQQTLEILAPDGLLAITSYFQAEHDLALAALRGHGGDVLLDLPHLQARPLKDIPGKAVDRRLALVKRLR